MRRDGISPSFLYICRSVYYFPCGLSGGRTHHQTIVKHLEQILETEFYFTMFFPVVPSQPRIDCKKKGKRQKNRIIIKYKRLQIRVFALSNKKRSLSVRSLAWARFNPASDASTKGSLGRRSPITFYCTYCNIFSNTFLLRLLDRPKLDGQWDKGLC